MNTLVTGGTGFIGSAVCRNLLAHGHHVTVLTRDKRSAQTHSLDVDFVESLHAITPIKAPSVVINLAGQSLASARWSPRTKPQFIASRVNTTALLIDYIERATHKPTVLLSASAVGVYGARGDDELDETAAPGDEYQSALCQTWEAEALKAQAYGVRVCVLRMGVVLDRAGGALPSMITPFRFGLGGHLGDGRQWISWIHLHDLVNSVSYLMENPELSGPFNLTAPFPQTNRSFATALGHALHRPVFVRIPGWAVRLNVGEMAHLYLTGQKVLPKRLTACGFEFSYPKLASAFREIFDEAEP